MKTTYTYENNIVSEIIGKQPAWLIRAGAGLLLFVIMVVLAFASFIQYPDVIKSSILITSDVPPVQLVSKRSAYIKQL